MRLYNVIATLEEHPPTKRIKLGFNRPHSYRGYYERLAFNPANDITVGEMLIAAREADGSMYEGYKGGEFEMDSMSECYIAEYGCCGSELSPMLLDYMLRDEVKV